MIPGYPPNTSYRTIAMGTWGIPMCAAQAGCPKNLGWRAHWHGRTDRHGMVHWKQADARATRRGMRNLAKLVAISYNRLWREQPVWKRLYLTNNWAYWEIRKHFHYRMRKEWSQNDRTKAWSLATRRERQLRTQHRKFYTWATR